jgi:hypothetical protein
VPNTTKLHGIKGLDVRGDGGYVVVAPSSRDDGEYAWENDIEFAPLPAWITKKRERHDQTPAKGMRSDDLYAEKALAGCITELAGAQEGTRNDTLNKTAFRLYQFVGAGRLAEHEIEQLATIARSLGLPESEIAATLHSAAAGKAQPEYAGTQTRRNRARQPEGRQQESAETSSREQTAENVPSAAIIKLRSLGYSFALNDVSEVVEVNGLPLDDVVAAEMRVRMRRAAFNNMNALADEIIFEAAQHRYHPIKTYLTSLNWDGTDYIGQLADKMSSPDDPIRYGDGSSASLHYVYLKRWLIGAVAKALDSKQNGMLVLAGPQGIGKSELVRWLASGIAGYYLEGPIEPKDKDNDVRLMSYFVWEVSELDATTRKADVAAIKAFVTKHTVVVRKAYGRHDTVKPALCSLIGTVNNGNGFLNDETGNRRFYVTTIEAIDWSYMTIPVDQIWAQAVALYRAGESWRLLPEEAGHQTHQNEQYEVETPLEAWIAHAFLFTGNSEDRITMADVYFQLGEHIRENQRTRNEISAVLRKFGAERGRTGRARYYQGVRIRHSEEQLPTMVDSLVSTVTPGDRLQSPPDSAAE